MGNLDFLEKKPRIAYTLSWDGVTEGKVTNTQASRKVYKISSEEFIPRPDIVWTPTGSSGIPCNTPENIRLEKNYRFINDEGIPNVEVSVLSEDKNKAGYYKFWLLYGDDGRYADLYYVLVANKAIISGDFGGGPNPIFPETGWYFGGATIEAGDIMSILKDPLVQFSYSGKGFTSPKKPYSYVSRSVKPDDDICIWIDGSKIPEDTKSYKNGFNAFCIPGDFNLEADIKLDKVLSDIYKHSMNLTLSAYLVNWLGDPTPYYANIDLGDSNHILIEYDKIDTNPEVINGLSIKLNGIRVYFNPAITMEELKEWYAKYFSNTP